jgi:hypothetical protein
VTNDQGAAVDGDVDPEGLLEAVAEAGRDAGSALSD